MGAALKYKKADYRKDVEAMLRSYHWLNEMVQEQNKNLMPSCTSSAGDDGIRGYSEFISPTEKMGVKRADNFYKANLVLINESLRKLSFKERIVIQETYLREDKQPVLEVCFRLGMKERSYYRLKREAIEKLAYWMDFK
ncbi:ArpU family phage packaging/lysis transcriptional regulator [Risungbinella massiliensis]|uniref:ArpU family phage packaging/lysis transcriptional regulator n=1 Tax=Risungbinella massiliensis TaxID=1329796 RepID=UPI0005CB94A3|nr:ArpU family phage packaging/lysis transcriptional regulator [Risungbinella massiliensis]